MELQVAVLSKVGGRNVNEDACGFWSSQTHAICFCIVSDGAGGHGGGDVASKLTVQSVLDWFRQRPDCSADAVEQALRHANDVIVRHQCADTPTADMRATVVALAIDAGHNRAIWGHIGDSRLYHLRQGQILAQTHDHSMAQSMVDAGFLPRGDLRKSPHLSSLLAALGDRNGVEPEVEPTYHSIMAGDAFLLCTDGLWQHAEESDMERLFSEAASPETWLRELEAIVLARGGSTNDNYSGLVVACGASSAAVDQASSTDLDQEQCIQTTLEQR